MPAPLLSRPAQTRAVGDFLVSASAVPSALLVEGEPGIGKTTGHGRRGELTVSEQRVADLAASGMTNQDVAAALFISPKTVEANLARIYRKLGIHSRAELGRLVAQPEP